LQRCHCATAEENRHTQPSTAHRPNETEISHGTVSWQAH
jgi:hypothetical protein